MRGQYGPSYRSCSCIEREGTCSSPTCSDDRNRSHWQLARHLQPHRLVWGPSFDPKFFLLLQGQIKSFFLRVASLPHVSGCFLSDLSVFVLQKVFQYFLPLNDDIRLSQFFLVKRYHILTRMRKYYLFKHWSSSWFGHRRKCSLNL